MIKDILALVLFMLMIPLMTIVFIHGIVKTDELRDVQRIERGVK